MIISKTPYRVSLFGGSTDYKSFYKDNGSLLLGFGLNKYQYVTVHNLPHGSKNFIEFHGNEIVEKVGNISELHNRAVRGTLEYMDWKTPIYISTNGDIQTQTGLGSSSSFIVGLLKALDCLKGVSTDRKALANDVIHIERVELYEAGGVQDQIWATYGGFNSIEINTKGNFAVRPLPLSKKFLNYFKKHSILVYTGQQRDSFNVAESHDNPTNIDYKKDILKIAQSAYWHFQRENMSEISRLLKKSWELKKQISPLISSERIDNLCDIVKSCGATGWKLLGCGKDGFLFCVVDNIENFKQKMNTAHLGVSYLDVGFDWKGSRVIKK